MYFSYSFYVTFCNEVSYTAVDQNMELDEVLERFRMYP